MVRKILRWTGERGQRGFTLMETVVAVVMLGVSTWAAMQGIKTSMLLTRNAMDRLYAAHFAEYTLDYYRHVPLNVFTDAAPPAQPSTRYDDYRKVIYHVATSTTQTQDDDQPTRFKVTVTPYHLKVWGGTEWVANTKGAVTMWSDFYSGARGQ